MEYYFKCHYSVHIPVFVSFRFQFYHILLNIQHFQFCDALRAQCYIAILRAKRAQIPPLLLPPPPPPPNPKRWIERYLIN